MRILLKGLDSERGRNPEVAIWMEAVQTALNSPERIEERTALEADLLHFGRCVTLDGKRIAPEDWHEIGSLTSDRREEM